MSNNEKIIKYLKSDQYKKDMIDDEKWQEKQFKKLRRIMKEGEK